MSGGSAVKKKKLDTDEPGGLQLYQLLLDQVSLSALLFTIQINSITMWAKMKTACLTCVHGVFVFADTCGSFG